MIWLLLALAYAAAAYQILAIVAALSHRKRALPAADSASPVSILKPVYGADPGFFEAISTHAAQQFREFEILFGIPHPDDPARGEIERLMREFPGVSIRLVLCPTETPNRKAGVLMDLAREARYPVLIVNDSDISVPPVTWRT